MREKKWQYKNKAHKPELIRETARKYRLPMVIAAILLNRGVQGEEIQKYFEKSMKDIINPMEMKDMDKAAERVKAAIDKHEKIMIYGDYDVDGITSVTIMYDFLRSKGADVDYYIPERANEGYGLSIKPINKMVKQGVKLIISVDCGITALGEVSFAKLSGIDMVITDHHTCKERIPEDAVAVVDPKREDDEYPFDGLCGAGVAFKLALAVTMLRGENTNECFRRYIDLVAVGTVADVMPLTNENRVLVDRGIKALQHTKRAGLAALLTVSGAKEPYNTSTIGFSIAPRLNAAGRLGNASTGVELLMETDFNKAMEIAKSLDEANKQRQETEQRIFEEALDMVARDPNFEKKKVIVLHKEGWHQGVIGIVASRINEKFYRPCILLSDDGRGNSKGSGRSVRDFNLFDALSYCDDCLADFGGHSAAAGLNINTADIEKFSNKINAYADAEMTEDTLTPKLDIDCPLNGASINIAAAKSLELLEPFGMSNEKPLFAVTGAVIEEIAAVGNEGKHLRLRLIKDNLSFKGIAFSMGALASELSAGEEIDVAFWLDINRYQGNESVQLMIKDIKLACKTRE